jgi:hypothetical protein
MLDGAEDVEAEEEEEEAKPKPQRPSRCSKSLEEAA